MQNQRKETEIVGFNSKELKKNKCFEEKKISFRDKSTFVRQIAINQLTMGKNLSH